MKNLENSPKPQLVQITLILLFIEKQKLRVLYSSDCNFEAITYPHLTTRRSGRIFPGRRNAGFFQGSRKEFSRGWPKVVKFYFTTRS